MRKKSETSKLAIWFVETYLKRSFDYRRDMLHLSHAKKLMNPGKDKITGEKLESYSIDDIKYALGEINRGCKVTNWRPMKIESLALLFWSAKSGATYIDEILNIPPRPPSYQGVFYDTWVREYGERAIRNGAWDGVYVGWGPHRNPGDKGVMGLKELESIIGTDLALKSYKCHREVANAAKKQDSGSSNDSSD